MLDELVKQVRRLFSSKNNGGKQVPQLTDRFHTHKQVLMALSLAILLGYSRSRNLFACEAVKGIDLETLTDFCLTNGTSTVISNDADQQPPHVGLGVVTNARDYPVISHNYIRSLWALFILLAICSYFPQRRWASLFENDTLRALLRLPGHMDSKLVLAAEQARPYEMLSHLSRESNADRDLDQTRLCKNELVMYKIEMVERYNNIYDHKLDYYPNQLIYLLLASNTAAYKYSFPKLRSKLIWYALWSTAFTVMQFILPITFVGLEYRTYGWEYAGLLTRYLISLAKSHQPVSYMNSVDYNLSMRIFPTVTQCDFRQNGMTGEMERLIVQCTVAMNEICGKLFFVIWWVVVINIFVEIWSLFMLLIGSFCSTVTSFVYGYRYWPAMREQADIIASFRYRRAALLSKRRQVKELRKQLRQSNLIKGKSSKKTRIAGGDQANGVMSEKERKRLEAEGHYNKRTRYTSESDSYQGENWLMACLSGLIVSIIELVRNIVCCLTSRRRSYYENEVKRDINIYYLLYLVYLRLGKSRSQTEDVIRMTSVALKNYLLDLEAQCNRDDDDSGAEEESDEVAKTTKPGEKNEEDKKINTDFPSEKGNTIDDALGRLSAKNH